MSTKSCALGKKIFKTWQHLSEKNQGYLLTKYYLNYVEN